MKRFGGELFWCHVTGRAVDPKHPHAAGIWSFEDLSSRRALKVEFTAREREIAALLIEGLTSKQIGKKLDHQPAHRRRLSRAPDAQGRRGDDAGAGAQAVDGLNRHAAAERRFASRVGRAAGRRRRAGRWCCRDLLAAWPRYGARDALRERVAAGLCDGAEHVLKLFPPDEGDHAAVEARVLAALHDALPVPTPRLLANGTADGWHYLLMSQLRGIRLVDAWPQLSGVDRDGLADALGECVAALHAVDVAPLADLEPHWDDFIAAQRASAVERQGARRLDRRWTEQIDEFLERWMPAPDARRSLLHTELMREHLLVDPDGRRLSGLFDFEPAMVGVPEYDFASFGLFVACGDGRFLRRTLLAYGAAPGDLDTALQCRLMVWAILHRYSNLRWYLERMPAQGETTLEALAARWWAFD